MLILLLSIQNGALMTNEDFLKMKFYDVLSGAVDIKIMAMSYFDYEVIEQYYIRTYFGDTVKHLIFLDQETNFYKYVYSEKQHGDFVDFFIKASKECNEKIFTRYQALMEIKKLAIEGSIYPTNQEYVNALKKWLFQKYPRGRKNNKVGKK
jgi:hypothetical protein